MKRLALILSLALLAMTAFAAQLTPEQAELRARQFLDVQRHGTLARTAPGYYIFNFNPGFVVISADDLLGGVLGFSEDGFFDNADAPEAMLELLDGYGNTIAAAPAEPAYKTLSQPAPKSIHAGNVVIGPLVTTKWAQTGYYNSKCPEDPNGSSGHAQVGCGALVMGTIMRYWQYPVHGVGSKTYNCNFSAYGYGDYGTLSVNFAEATYDYANMPDKLNYKSTEEQVDAVSTLLYHCGVACGMAYGPKASTSQSGNIVSALKTYFSYPDSVVYTEKQFYSDAEWLALLQQELNDRAPFMYGASGSYGGHVFICDGYRDDNYFHLVWGWGGSYDGYFAIGDFTPGPYDFNNNHAAILRIRGPQLPSSVTDAQQAISVTITPNPARELVEVTADDEILSLSLLSLTGAQLLTAENTSTLNVSALPSGTYLLRVTTSASTTTHKLIIQ